ncbi:hypothetical protein SNE40_015971 [Patella caerulea]|uniref:ATP synthase-coupling factor 6, mitochondrial n=1 Tax=Patella caerulea TaxID=87958 RepID=A0AAN8PB89_PATCE
MVLTRVWSSVGTSRHVLIQQAKRNIGVSAVALQKAKLDPIQQMFVDKIREYAQKSKASGGKLVDATPESEKALKESLAKLETVYNAKGQDMTKFPSFNFTDPELDPIGMSKD